MKDLSLAGLSALFGMAVGSPMGVSRKEPPLFAPRQSTESRVEQIDAANAKRRRKNAKRAKTA